LVRLRDVPFDAWLEHAFGREVRIGRNPWFFDLDSDWWEPRSADYVNTLTRLFENPEPLMEAFADSQIAQGLTYLVDTAAVGDDGHLADPEVPIADRLRFVRSTATLFARLFAVRCTPRLSHLDEPGCGLLNGRCYMWWDTFPSIGLDGDRHLADMRQATLETLARILSIDSIPCQESALHGLGHWSRQEGGTVERIIDDFIESHPTARPELLRYARVARGGCIL
jgi:hypothetical protein